MTTEQALSILETLNRNDALSETVRNVERGLRNATTPLHYESAELSQVNTLAAALRVKHVAGRINDVIHASAILIALPRILDPNEEVSKVSLASGNTGRSYDLETNRRIAEFKLIRWRGGAEAVRQDGLFKDFFRLAEDATPRRKCLYVTGLEHPKRFLSRSTRSVLSVTRNNRGLAKQIERNYGTDQLKVHEYYEMKASAVELVDLLEAVPEIGEIWCDRDD